MTIQHKLSDLAKDLGVQNKALIDLFTQWTGEVKKHTAQLTEAELNRVFEYYTRQAEVSSLDEYLDSAPKAKAPELKKADGTPVKTPPQKRKERIRAPKPEKEKARA